MRLALLVGAVLAAMPAPAFAKSLYVETGKLVDVVAGKVLRGQCISVVDDKIVALDPCATTHEGEERVDWSA